MLFSQPAVAEFLDAGFECAWESVRDVPEVTIDFGGGAALRRTMMGNVATWYCTADGAAFGVLPGLADAAEFVAVGTRALAAHAEARRSGHLVPVAIARQRMAAHVVDAVPPPPVSAAPATGQPDVSKRVVEAPVRMAAGVPMPEDVVALDSAWNRAQRYAAAQAMLLGAEPAAGPTVLRDRLFDEILHVPLRDPFLGLAPWTPGGEGGRVLGGAPVGGPPMR